MPFTASLNRAPMMLSRNLFLNSKSTKKSTAKPSAWGLWT